MRIGARCAPGAEQEPHPAVMGEMMRQGTEVVASRLLRRDPHGPLERDQDRITEHDGAQASEQEDQSRRSVELGAQGEIGDAENRRDPAGEHHESRSPLGASRPDLLDRGRHGSGHARSRSAVCWLPASGFPQWSGLRARRRRRGVLGDVGELESLAGAGSDHRSNRPGRGGRPGVLKQQFRRGNLRVFPVVGCRFWTVHSSDSARGWHATGSFSSREFPRREARSRTRINRRPSLSL